jgi:guanine deaminase
LKDLEFAKSVYSRVVSKTLSLGTTTACYFATIHLPATELLADIVIDCGQRALVGNFSGFHTLIDFDFK